MLARLARVPLVGLLALARLVEDVGGHVLGGHPRRRLILLLGPTARLLPVARVERLLAALGSVSLSSLLAHVPLLRSLHCQPPIGALGFEPQKICVPTIPIRWTITVFSTIDFAVAVPTPTGPPLAL